jgi:LacI family transcriptional regulator
MNQSDHHQDEWSATMMHGALVLPGRNLHIRQFIEQMNVPHVTINDQPMHDGESCVCVNDYQGAVDATEHLIKLGHRRIAYKDHIHRGGPDEYRRHYSIPDRRRGYVDAMCKHGLEPMAGFDQNVDVDEFLDRYILAQRATAVLAWENTQAVQILRLCEKAGIDVPGDLNVACFNEINYDSIPTDFVTVVDLPTEDMGRKASELLLKQMDDPDKHKGQKLVLPETLRIRRSTAPLLKTAAVTSG